MCGIFGILAKKDQLTDKELKNWANDLFKLSESRGKEACGIAIDNGKSINIFKENIPATDVISTKEFKSYFNESTKTESSIGIIGHSRLVTDGSEDVYHNNQPVNRKEFVTIHNGIVTNVNEIFNSNNGFTRKYSVDTEVIPLLLSKHKKDHGNLKDACINTLNEIEGTASLAIFSTKDEVLVLTTNNGSLYYVLDVQKNVLVFASESHILQQFVKNKSSFNSDLIRPILPNTGIIFNKLSLKESHFSTLQKDDNRNQKEMVLPGNLDKVVSFKNEKKRKEKKGSLRNFTQIIKGQEKLLEFNISRIKQLTKCTKCLLPETFPYISFNSHGVCNFCENYKTKFPKNEQERRAGEEKLRQILKPYRRKKKDQFDVIVPFSGGRDSSYGLHYIKNELDLNPITFTYDWGMVTDLARRNIARICGNLGVENIIVSADIRKKREYIRKNVLAWLKKPDLGIIPILMAGDKYFFYHVNRIKKQIGVDLNIWMGNKLETTDFKTGFAKIAPKFDKEKIYKIGKLGQAKLASYYLKNFLLNPAYLNSSLFDTIGSFYVYYSEPRNDTYLLFDYVDWNERKIEDVLINRYNWETSPDTKSTWRIGDGTASFYNYVYYTIAGFSEIDTFRSNQIREGMLTREEALALAEEENVPRYNSMKWYLDIIGVDFEFAIKKINNTPKLY